MGTSKREWMTPYMRQYRLDHPEVVEKAKRRKSARWRASQRVLKAHPEEFQAALAVELREEPPA